jgi:tetratricopeptide (TPR) repeat protein
VFIYDAIPLELFYFSDSFGLGYCYQMLNHISKAISYFQKAIELNPGYVEVYCNLGEIHGTSGELGKAVFYLVSVRKFLSVIISVVYV